ncbi:MAG: peptidoglycan editing factor PgeF [Immundisolibacteraceae bacterium]|nr:peptidoglycan editing factor PgeF [Immundisolibacteraceae bacterium]
MSGAESDNLNLATHVGDNADKVTENRTRLISQTSMPAQPYWLDQQHSNQIINCQTSVKNQLPPTADGSFTDLPNRVCVVLTADCLPILIRSTDGHQLAAVHAGWRGLHNGVIGNALKQFAGSPAIAWIGPAIGPQAYQVDESLKSSFVNLNSDYEASFTPVSANQWRMDLVSIATHQLRAEGLAEVYTSDICCYQDTRFYSYRRDPDCGRMATLIWRDST